MEDKKESVSSREAAGVPDENQEPTPDQYKESIKTLLLNIFAAAGKANIITQSGLNYEVLTKGNLITTALAEKDKVFESLKVDNVTKMMISGLISSFGGMAKGQIIDFDINQVKDAIIDFFTENAHTVDGLEPLMGKIKEDLDSRKKAKQ